MKKKSHFVLRMLRCAGYGLLSLISLVAAYLLIALGLSKISVPKESGQAEEMTIYIINNGVHTDIVMPVKSKLIDWSSWIPSEHTKGKDSSMPYIAMGWGDKGFYLETPTWAELKPNVAFNAVFGLGNAAMHTTYYSQIEPGAQCIAIALSYNQYQKLVNFILSAFQRDSAGRFKLVETNMQYGNHDAFYDAYGSYSMLHTCNTWANNALKAAGLRACYWTAFCKGIFDKHPIK